MPPAPPTVRARATPSGALCMLIWECVSNAAVPIAFAMYKYSGSVDAANLALLTVPASQVSASARIAMAEHCPGSRILELLDHFSAYRLPEAPSLLSWDAATRALAGVRSTVFFYASVLLPGLDSRRTAGQAGSNATGKAEGGGEGSE